jgi:hypothetical protein
MPIVPMKVAFASVFIRYREDCPSLESDFIYIIQRKLCGFNFNESKIIRSIGDKSYGVARNFVKYYPVNACPMWRIAVIQSSGDSDTTNRLTKLGNALLKVKAFAARQQAEIEELEETGFDRKMPKYYRRRIKGCLSICFLITAAARR